MTNKQTGKKRSTSYQGMNLKFTSVLTPTANSSSNTETARLIGSHMPQCRPQLTTENSKRGEGADGQPEPWQRPKITASCQNKDKEGQAPRREGDKIK